MWLYQYFTTLNRVKNSEYLSLHRSPIFLLVISSEKCLNQRESTPWHTLPKWVPEWRTCRTWQWSLVPHPCQSWIWSILFYSCTLHILIPLVISIIFRMLLLLRSSSFLCSKKSPHFILQSVHLNDHIQKVFLCLKRTHIFLSLLYILLPSYISNHLKFIWV